MKKGNEIRYRIKRRNTYLHTENTFPETYSTMEQAKVALAEYRRWFGLPSDKLEIIAVKY